jgi:hypothetical protein
VEAWIKSETGIPIQLPSKISFKEIGGSLLSMIPKDFEQALDLGLAIGSQAAAGALTAALAGTAIGSVIPGLGTVVGLAVGLAVFALKGAVKDLFMPDPPPWRKLCENENPKVFCPKIPRKLSPIELLPWAVEQMQRIKPLVEQQKRSQKCAQGEGPNCLGFLENLSWKAYELTMPRVGDLGDTLKQVGMTGRSYAVGQGPRLYTPSTPAQLGLPEVNRLISLYERAPRNLQQRESVLKGEADFDPRVAAWRVRGDLTQPGWRGHMDFVLAALKQRRAELEAFLKTKESPYVPPSKLLQEIEKATQQYGLARSENAKKWFETMSKLYAETMAYRSKALIEQKKQNEAMWKRNQSIYEKHVSACKAGDPTARAIFTDATCKTYKTVKVI